MNKFNINVLLKWMIYQPYHFFVTNHFVSKAHYKSPTGHTIIYGGAQKHTFRFN